VNYYSYYTCYMLYYIKYELIYGGI
jgi:hypothetical protein